MIELSHLTFKYDETDSPILDDQSLTIDKGSFNLLTGPSGTGKSTLLKLIAGLYPSFTGIQTAGTVTVNQQVIAEMIPAKRAQLVSMMFQNPSEQFAMQTPREELIFTLENLQVPVSDIPTRAQAALEFSGVTAFADRQFTTLSGGEQQKVSLAVIVALNAQVILLDEPFANVDPAARRFLLAQLTKLVNQQGKTILIADHDLSDYQARINQLFILDPTKRRVHLADNAEATARFADFDQQQHQQQPVSLPDLATLKPVFKLNNFSVGHQHPLIVQDALDLFANQLTVITGANGTGKSTLFNALVRLQDYHGSLTWQDQQVSKQRRARYAKQVALVFQQATSQFLNITVAEELAMSHRQQVSSAWTTARTTAALEQLNLAGRDEQVVYSLSEGQKKKLQILTMLIMGTPTLLLDEPLTGLDLISEQAVLQLLQEAVHEDGRTVLMITHQLTHVATFADLHLHLDQQHLTYEASL